MLRKSLTILLLCFTVQQAWCQYSLSGVVLEDKTNNPIGYALVEVNDHELWAVTNDKGEFLLKNVSGGEILVTVSCLGYAKKAFEVKVAGDIDDLSFHLPEDNLQLEEVVVTAQAKSNELSTAYVIDRAALEHSQMLGAADVMGLLPGGQTNRSLHMATSGAQTITLRAGSGETGNAAFGTAIEVDGVRLSSNATFGADRGSSVISVGGTDTRSIGASNIESIEVVTGIASVTYGDMTQGVVKINTRKGRSPWQAEAKTNPNTKLFSVNKGFGLGPNAGTLNASYEWAKSINDPASPFRSYEKNAMSLLYDNTFNRNTGQPISFTFGVSGNVGGYDDKDDPDLERGQYEKIKDNTLRVHTRVNYLLNLPWITNLELKGSVDYSNKMRDEMNYRRPSSSIAVHHGREEGYFMAQVFDEYPDAPIVIIPPGHYYELMHFDNKPLTITAAVNARWSKKIGALRNNFLLGADFNRTGNYGRGLYPDDFRLSPDWREDRLDEYPFMNNLAVYAEDKIDLNMGKSLLQVMAGLRSDITSVKGSEYGTVNSMSPRTNIKFTFPENKGGWVERVSLRAGYGKSVKLPSFNMLYPAPVYEDRIVFGQSISGNENFTASYIYPFSLKYNPDLKWQYTNQIETGADIKIKGVSIALSVFQTKTLNSYQRFNGYDPFSYNFAGTNANVNYLEKDCLIPKEDRRFSIDQATGDVTVNDMTGEFPSELLPHSKIENYYKQTTSFINGSPAVRRGIEWIVDFGKIQSLQTSIRVDGKYYYYKSVDETMNPQRITTRINDEYNKYLAFHVGNTTFNGTITKQLLSNVTLVTHIPAMRLIVTLRVEGSLYHYTRNLMEYDGKPYGFVIDKREDDITSNPAADIYAGNQLVAKYPLYYVSYDDMNTKIPFAETFLAAYAEGGSDDPLVRELRGFINKSGFDYQMNDNGSSAYASANIGITKEFGKFASITFDAKNFLNTMQLVESKWTGQQESLFSHRYIPLFYYGLTLKLKF